MIVGGIISGTAMAQTTVPTSQAALPDGWVSLESTKPTDTVALFKHEVAASALTVNIVPNDKIVDFINEERARLEPICPGISSVQMETNSSDAGALIVPVSSMGTGCSISLVGEGPRGAVVTTIGAGASMPMAFVDDAITIGRTALKIYAAKNSISTKAFASSLGKGQAQPVASSRGGANAKSPTSLQAAVAAIPANNRPIAMINVSQWDSVAMSMMPKPYILFANGYAVDECDPWDFTQMAPTPQALRSIGSDCTVKRWQKIGNSYRLQDSDGDWSEPGEAGYIRGFKAGERINVNHSNRGGAGGYGSSSTWGAGLRMTTDGQFASSQWSGVAISTTGASGYSANRGGTSGTYYLDGFIIAVQDESGQISLGTIGRKVESGGTYIYLNGDMMWD